MKGVRSFPQVALRLSPDLKAWVIRSAHQNHRSINGEIVHRLEEARQSEMSKEEKTNV